MKKPHIRRVFLHGVWRWGLYPSRTSMLPRGLFHSLSNLILKLEFESARRRR